MKKNLFTLILVLLSVACLYSQNIYEDDFEGNGNISTWFGDNCTMDINFDNPFSEGINTSNKVLRYHDVGGQYANVRFDASNNFDLMEQAVFSLKVYVPSNGLTGNQPNQISLKLQDGSMPMPWATQSEIIKPIVLNQWQTIEFDFQNDNYINLDVNSPPPSTRTDFSRVVIQLNGENNNDQVLAYLDDFSNNASPMNPPIYDNLVWADEFETAGPINPMNWYPQTEFPVGNSWFNGEIQHYTDRIDNAYVDNGTLKIVAKKENFTDQGQTKAYTSARLNSKFAFKYGRVEIRAKLPSGIGTWPAIWTLGKNINENGAYWQTQGFGTTGWPACGEIDIMEHWGTNQNYVQSATHTPSSFGNTMNLGGQLISTASISFHTYVLEWYPDKLIFSVDGNVHFVYQPEIFDANTWPFNQEQYLLLNVAILPSILPSFTSSAMEIDYVRVYQESPLSNVQLDENKTDVLLYPNPFFEKITIQLKEVKAQDLPIHIYSIDGKWLRTIPAKIRNEELEINNLQTLESGVYLIKFQLGNQSYVRKVIKAFR